MKKTKLTLLLIISMFLQTRAQEFDGIFEGGIEDATTYLQAYTGPLMQSLSNGLGNGWYNTAKPHKLLGFDLTITVNVVNVSSSEREFIFDEDDYQNLELASGDPNLPTAVGGSSDTRIRAVAGRTISDGTNTIILEEAEEFDAPSGFNVEDLPIISGLPVPAVQLGIGLPKNTDLKLRYASDFGAFDDGNLAFYGVGVLHDVKQWIPGLRQVPFDFAGFVGYTFLDADYKIEEGSASGDYQADGEVEIGVYSFTIQGIVSKKLSIFTPYLGLGYTISGSDFDVNGDFIYREGGRELTFSDPVSLDFDGGSTYKINAGLRIKLAILTLHAEYVLQESDVFTVGVGFSVR
ncbi:MAG: DUF6588 family protein [Bacteroidota bacterium]